MSRSLWVPLDVNFLWDSKIVACDIEAQILFVRGLCLAKQTGSNGFVSSQQVAQLCFDLDDHGTLAAAQLVREALWLEDDEGYRIAAWFKHNKTADEAEKISELRREAGRRGGKASSKQVASDSGSKTEAEESREEERRVEKKSPGTAPAVQVNSEATRLAELLALLVAGNGAKVPATLDAWTQDLDRLIRLDQRAPTEIEAVIRWCQNDSFWKSNILSASKLRKQYDQLNLKRQATSNGHRKNDRDSLTGASESFLARHQ